MEANKKSLKLFPLVKIAETQDDVALGLRASLIYDEIVLLLTQYVLDN